AAPCGVFRMPDGGAERAAEVRETYGASFGQLAQLGVPDLHQRGLDGAGVRVALFDSGFHKAHPALAHLDLVAEWDFVDGDAQTQNWDGEQGSGDYHGTFTLTALGGYAPGALIGPAHRASFALARTEDVDLELRAEEDHYVAALEWADSLGAAVISTSLGYRCFPDDGGFCYEPEALDGQTAVTSRAVNEAAARGILVVVSAGNEGPQAATLNTPADAPGALAIGALQPWGVPTDFSSRGPTADGRLKPDLCAQGSHVICGRWYPGITDIGPAGGTSLAAPLVAGLGTLLASRLPAGLAAADLAQIMRESGTRSDSPANDYGHGSPWGPSALAQLEARAEATLGIDSLRWSVPPAAGVLTTLRLRLRNRGTAACAGGEIVLRPWDAELVCDSSARRIPALEAGASAWVGPWQCDLGAIPGSWLWTAVLAELALEAETTPRWTAFRLEAPFDPGPTARLRCWPQPWRGTEPLRLWLRRSRAGPARIDLYDVAGRHAERLAVGLALAAGSNLIELPASRSAGLPAGCYWLCVSGSGERDGCPLLRLR
ncbi:MAG: S8 family serine peptidase, partial [Candidatus Eisenbacteria bacterium]|nr:S8 family serine peptidase [Candidatus Eisenbacteria bacterium]